MPTPQRNVARRTVFARTKLPSLEAPLAETSPPATDALVRERRGFLSTPLEPIARTPGNAYDDNNPEDNSKESPATPLKKPLKQKPVIPREKAAVRFSSSDEPDDGGNYQSSNQSIHLENKLIRKKEANRINQKSSPLNEATEKSKCLDTMSGSGYIDIILASAALQLIAQPQSCDHEMLVDTLLFMAVLDVHNDNKRHGLYEL
jgi:hypothetical protein